MKILTTPGELNKFSSSKTSNIQFPNPGYPNRLSNQSLKQRSKQINRPQIQPIL